LGYLEHHTGLGGVCFVSCCVWLAKAIVHLVPLRMVAVSARCMSCTPDGERPIASPLREEEWTGPDLAILNSGAGCYGPVKGHPLDMSPISPRFGLSWLVTPQQESMHRHSTTALIYHSMAH
jgi:hypothetical protein